jgi:hypothetical protein
VLRKLLTHPASQTFDRQHTHPRTAIPTTPDEPGVMVQLQFLRFGGGITAGLLLCTKGTETDIDGGFTEMQGLVYQAQF